MKTLLSILVGLQIGMSVAHAVIVEDMVLVPDENHPFYISIFEVPEEKYKQVMGISRYQIPEWPAIVGTPKQAEDFCKRQGLRMPTIVEWYTAASNMGKHKEFTVVGDAIGENKAFNFGGGDSCPVYQYEELGIDGIGTVAMSGNRAEWVMGAHGEPLQCGGDFRIQDVNLFKLGTICGDQNSPIWSKFKTTVRCVIDYSPDIQVVYSKHIKGKLKKHLDRLQKSMSPELKIGGSSTLSI